MSQSSSPPRPKRRDPPPGAEIGPYALGSRLDQGSYGSVYRAEGPSGPAVLKVTRYPDHPRRRERLLVEARLLAELDHPGVVACLAHGQDEDWTWFAMPWDEGVPMVQDALPRERAVGVCLQVLDALGYLHERGVVHRDVKPTNLLGLPDGRVQLIDFGLALRPEGGSDWRPSRVGTDDFRAPEQARDAESVDGRADLYSLGVSLHAFLTGYLPEETEDGRTALAGELPTDLFYVISRLVEPDPALRYATAAEAAAVLRRCVDEL